MYCAAGASPCLLICDDAFIAKYGLGMVRPRRLNLRRRHRRWLRHAGRFAGRPRRALRHRPATALIATVARHNGFASTGVDLDFGKGSDVYQRNLGDPAHAPNPCIGAIAKPPFYAVEVHAGDIGASAGLVTNEHAQVLRRTARPCPASTPAATTWTR